MVKKIGSINETAINLLKLDTTLGTPILLGQTNIDHMKETHPDDFKRYFAKITDILEKPNYIVPNPKDGSLQYIKELDQKVLVAIRVSSTGSYYARSIYSMSKQKIENWSQKGLFEKYRVKDNLE